METTRQKIGYKTSKNGVCMEMTYKVGETYKTDKPIKMCEWGFHYCTNIDDVFHYYPYNRNTTKIFEIEDMGDTSHTVYDKTVTNKIRIIREIPVSEYNTLFKCNTFDERGNLVHTVYARGEWDKVQFDDKNRMVRFDTDAGFWKAWTYNDETQTVLVTDSGGLYHTIPSSFMNQ